MAMNEMKNIIFISVIMIPGGVLLLFVILILKMAYLNVKQAVAKDKVLYPKTMKTNKSEDIFEQFNKFIC